MISFILVLTLITHVHGVTCQALRNITASDPVQGLGQLFHSCCTALSFTPPTEKLISLLWRVVGIFNFNIPDNALFNLELSSQPLQVRAQFLKERTTVVLNMEWLFLQGSYGSFCSLWTKYRKYDESLERLWQIPCGYGQCVKTLLH